MKMNRSFCASCLLLGWVCCLFWPMFTVRVSAGTLTWDSDANATNGQTDGSGFWTGGTTWRSGANDVVWGSGNTTVYGVPGAAAGNFYTVTNSATAYSGVQCAQITFQGGSSYTLTGNAFNVQTAILIGADVTSAQTISAAFSYGTSGQTTATITNNASSSAGTINLSSGIAPNSAGAGGTLNLAGTGTGNNVISGVISQSGAGAVVVNISGGRWTFSGANTFKGGATVTGGVLNLGSATTLQSATGSLAIAGGTLSSSVAASTVGGGVALSTGYVDLNGANAGAMTLAANQNFTMNGGEMLITLGTAFDQVLGSGIGTFSITDGVLRLDVSGTGFSYGNTYALFSGFSSGSVSSLDITGYDTVGYTAELSSAGVLSFTAVPEATTWSLLLGAMALMGVRSGLQKRLGRAALRIG